MKVELVRFKVKEGKSKQVDAWLKFLNANMKDVLVTLDGEKMFVETIFREQLNGDEFLYWIQFKGKADKRLKNPNIGLIKNI